MKLKLTNRDKDIRCYFESSLPWRMQVHQTLPQHNRIQNRKMDRVKGDVEEMDKAMNRKRKKLKLYCNLKKNPCNLSKIWHPKIKNRIL